MDDNDNGSNADASINTNTNTNANTINIQHHHHQHNANTNTITTTDTTTTNNNNNNNLSRYTISCLRTYLDGDAVGNLQANGDPVHLRPLPGRSFALSPRCHEQRHRVQ